MCLGKNSLARGAGDYHSGGAWVRRGFASRSTSPTLRNGRSKGYVHPLLALFLLSLAEVVVLVVHNPFAVTSLLIMNCDPFQLISSPSRIHMFLCTELIHIFLIPRFGAFVCFPHFHASVLHCVQLAT